MEGNIYDGVGIIVDYKYLIGEGLKGKVYRRRFENVEAFVKWCEEYDNTGIVKIINSRIVDATMVYWDDRWVQPVEASV